MLEFRIDFPSLCICGFVLTGLLFITGCSETVDFKLNTHYRVTANEAPTEPERIHLYLDVSKGMQGYFNARSGADFIRRLPQDNVTYYRFAKVNRWDPQPIKLLPTETRDFGEMINTKQVRNGEKLFTGVSNRYSNIIEHFAEKFDSESISVLITDGITSTRPREEYELEYSRLMRAMQNLSEREEGVSLYQYAMPFSGYYYLQPNDKERTALDSVSRNLFILVFGKREFHPFLDRAFGKELNAERYEHFRVPLQNRVRIRAVQHPGIYQDYDLELEISLGEKLPPPYRRLFEQQLHQILLVKDENDQTIPTRVIVDSVSRSRAMYARLEFEGDWSRIPKTLRLIAERNVDFPEIDSWEDLNNPLEEDPDSLDHARTYHLSDITNGLREVYNKEGTILFEHSFTWEKSSYLSGHRCLYFVLGKPSQVQWYGRLYYLLAGIMLFISLASALFFYRSHVFDNSNDGVSQKVWMRIWLTASFSVAAVSLIALLVWGSVGDEVRLSFGIQLAAAAWNGFLALLMYLLVSLLVRGQSRKLYHIPTFITLSNPKQK